MERHRKAVSPIEVKRIEIKLDQIEINRVKLSLLTLTEVKFRSVEVSCPSFRWRDFPSPPFRMLLSSFTVFGRDYFSLSSAADTAWLLLIWMMLLFSLSFGWNCFYSSVLFVTLLPSLLLLDSYAFVLTSFGLILDFFLRFSILQKEGEEHSTIKRWRWSSLFIWKEDEKSSSADHLLASIFQLFTRLTFYCYFIQQNDT